MERFLAAPERAGGRLAEAVVTSSAIDDRCLNLAVPLYAILDADVGRRAPAGRRSISRARSSTAARASCSSAPRRCPAARSSTLASAIVELRARRRRARHRQRSRRHRAARAAPTACTSGRTICRRAAVRAHRRRRRDRRPLDAHADAGRRARCCEPVTYVAIGPVFGTATKATGYDAVGLELVGEAAPARRGRGLPLVAIGGITLETRAVGARGRRRVGGGDQRSAGDRRSGGARRGPICDRLSRYESPRV